MNPSTPSKLAVVSFYETQIPRNLRDFVDGNARIEAAWETIERFAPKQPRRILEIGCGVGSISWRMSLMWPQAAVVGTDLSPDSLETARKLFVQSNLTFRTAPPWEGFEHGVYDLIVLMDVYEHIPVPDRPDLHQAIQRLRSEIGRFIMSFPTPRHLDWLRKFRPNEIQPVDENVGPQEVAAIATDTATDLLYYQDVSIWQPGDYAHAAFGRIPGWQDSTGAISACRPSEHSFEPPNVLQRFGNRLPRAAGSKVGKTAPATPWATKEQRSQLVTDRLGIDLSKPR